MSEFQEDELVSKSQELLKGECYPEISLNALTSVPTYNTKRVIGNVGKHLLHMLYDTGSTHNFLDLFTAKKLGCKLRKTYPLQVTVAGGRGRKKMCVRGTRQSELQWMSGKKLHKQSLLSISCVWPVATLHLMHTAEALNPESKPELKLLLQEFEDVFAIPSTHPLQRSFDHKIPLKDESTVVNIRPYRYPPIQKDVIKTMDGTWRMCIDYRQLNKNTVKDKFPIPIIEEVIDELNGAQTDASGYRIGALLQQNNHPIAFLNKTLALKHKSLSAYEKELLVVVLALQKWRGYLLDTHFKIKTDHFSLKYVLDQRITTPFQSKWLPKLLGFDYEIEYKQGKDNVVVDALSRVQRKRELFALLSASTSNEFMDSVTALWTTDHMLKAIVEKLRLGPVENSKYTWHDQQLRRKVKSKQLGRDWGILLLERDEEKGLLQPLPTPTQVWHDISMDFLDSLPMSQGKSTILVIADRLSKYVHFIAVTHPYTAKTIARLFLDNIHKLHGLPKTIVSDRDKIFMSLFWQSLFKMLQLQLKMSIAYHPQTDGQTEVVNKCLECYLRCMTGESPKDWTLWLPLAEYWYNTNYHTAIKTTPFEIMYGQPPALHIPFESVFGFLHPYMAKDSRVELVDRTLQAREKTISMLQFNLKKAQDIMKSQTDKHISDREFAVLDWVYLKLQPYRQLTVRKGRQHKLSSKCLTPNVAMEVFLECDARGLLAAEPIKLLERKIVKQQNRMGVFGLIQWSNGSEEDATWEDLADVVRRFPTFFLDP
ncbi:retrotransposon-related protein [Tanacetum coccineum]